MKKLVLLTISGLMISGLIFSQPNAFKYQTVVRDNSGIPVANRDIGLRISIIKGTIDGTVIYSESHTEMTNDHGLLSLTIGKGESDDDITSIGWSETDYFLRVGVDLRGGNNYREMGTSQLLSVPFSLYSGKSGISSLADTASFSIHADHATTSDSAKYFVTTLVDSVTYIDSIQTASYADTAMFANNVKPDKQIRIRFGGLDIATDSDEWTKTRYETLTLIKFNKNDYPGVDSIIFTPSAYSNASGINCYIQLYNLTDNVPIENSTVQSDVYDYIFIDSGNIYDYLPDKEIDLAIRIKSERRGTIVSTGVINYLFMFRR